MFEICALLLVHFIADYVLQTRWMGNNKSKRWDALLSHVGVYSLTLLAGSTMIFGATKTVLAFVFINGVTHLFTDFITSRATSYLWSQKREYETFVIMGADQLIHSVTLIATAYVLFGL